jgi:hypothetical protein
VLQGSNIYKYSKFLSVSLLLPDRVPFCPS